MTSRPGSAIARVWDEFWFSHGSPLDLAVARVLVAATSLWVLLSRDLPALSGVPPVFWSNTSESFQWRYLLFPGHEPVERWVQGVAVVCLACTILGLGVEIAAFVAGVILIHLMPLESFQWSSSAFTMSIPVIGLFVVAASPSAAALSLWPRHPPAAAAWAFRWPVQVIRVELCCLYFFSGYSKLIETGPSWASAAHLQAWILGFYQREHPVYTTLAPWVASHPWMCGAMGVTALIVELGFPVALVNRHARYALLGLALVMHIGIALVLNITVLYWPVLLVFVDWEEVIGRVRGRASPPAGAPRGSHGRT